MALPGGFDDSIPLCVPVLICIFDHFNVLFLITSTDFLQKLGSFLIEPVIFLMHSGV